MKRVCIFAAAIVFASTIAQAATKSKEIEYQSAGAKCRGYLVYDDAVQGKRPGVLVVHEWWGLNDYARHRANMLAELGYVAFAADMYGDARHTDQVKEAASLAGPLRDDRNLMRQRAADALNVLKQQEQTDPAKLAAIGYCFGGTTVLELARSGADILGVVSFHGGLDTPTPAKSGEVKARILVLTGADDPNVPPQQVQALQDEMKNAGAQCEVVSYPGAVHAFTNPDADKYHIKGIGYNKAADEKSWEKMKEFFKQIFGK